MGIVFFVNLFLCGKKENIICRQARAIEVPTNRLHCSLRICHKVKHIIKLIDFFRYFVFLVSFQHLQTIFNVRRRIQADMSVRSTAANASKNMDLC